MQTNWAPATRAFAIVTGLQPDPVSDPTLDETLDPGERAAIALALSTSADRLLIDDWEGPCGRASTTSTGFRIGGGTTVANELLSLKGPR